MRPSRALDLRRIHGQIVDQIKQAPPGILKGRLEKIAECGNALVLMSDGTVRHFVQRAGSPFPCGYANACPFCAHQARRERLGRISQWFDDHPSPFLYGATITIRHTPEESLREVYNRLRELWKALSYHIRMKRAGRHTDTRFPTPEGVFWGTEIIRSANGWHPHIHLIMTSEDRVDYKQANRYLADIGFAESAHIHFSLLRTPKDGSDFAKYSFKWDAPADLHEIIETISGMRTKGTLGNARGLEERNPWTPPGPDPVRMLVGVDLLTL